jgi:DNA invertase Pin-like site-specific DNA recombinase
LGDFFEWISWGRNEGEDFAGLEEVFGEGKKKGKKFPVRAKKKKLGKKKKKKKKSSILLFFSKNIKWLATWVNLTRGKNILSFFVSF